MKKLLLGISILILNIPTPQAQAAGITTPVQYCASLAATSCEVLNWEMVVGTPSSLAGLMVIKYCRNQKAGAVVFAFMLSSDVPSVNSGTTSGYKYTLTHSPTATGARNVNTALDSASLCAATIQVNATDSSPLLP